MYDDDGMREFIRWAKHYREPYPLDLDAQLDSPAWDPRHDMVPGAWGPQDIPPAGNLDDDLFPTTNDPPLPRTATGHRP